MSSQSSTDRLAIARNVAETLVFAAIGGLTLGLLRVPAGFLSGSILMVAAASLAGRPMLMPMVPMRILLVLIGISLGAVVTPATLNGMAAYPMSIAVLLAAMICISVSGAAYLRVVHGWDKMTAYLAAAPGGLSQVMGLAAELGCRHPRRRHRANRARRNYRGRLAGRAVAARARQPAAPAASADRSIPRSLAN